MTLQRAARIAALFALAHSLPAQTLFKSELVHNEHSPYIDLARGAAWSNSQGGKGFVSGFHVITPLLPDEGVCVEVSNLNPLAQHTVYFSAYQTPDQQQQSIIGSLAPQYSTGGNPKWTTVQPIFGNGQDTSAPSTNIDNRNYVPVGNPNFALVTVGAGTTVSIFIRFAAAARIAFYFGSDASAGSGSPDTADLYMVQGVNACNHPNPAGGTGSNVAVGSITTPAKVLDCPYYASFQGQTAGTFIFSQLTAFSTVGTWPYICHISASGTAVGDITISKGTNTNCGSFNVVIASYKNVGALALNYPGAGAGTTAAGSGGVNLGSGNASQEDLCLTLTGSGTWSGVIGYGVR